MDLQKLWIVFTVIQSFFFDGLFTVIQSADNIVRASKTAFLLKLPQHFDNRNRIKYHEYIINARCRINPTLLQNTVGELSRSL